MCQYLSYYMSILDLLIYSLCVILDMPFMCLYLFVISFNIRLFTRHFTLFFFLKLENTHIIRTRRVHQNRRETHNLVNNSQSIHLPFLLHEIHHQVRSEILTFMEKFKFQILVDPRHSVEIKF
ncbi:hypothetical protein HanRHA438_Chr09g0406281 [Helianthus annuus]|nr:hypothetical protein HanRHA438_Chr09g0406281 [Helianthus annuus]